MANGSGCHGIDFILLWYLLYILGYEQANVKIKIKPAAPKPGYIY
jgi:hypothetical protein